MFDFSALVASISKSVTGLEEALPIIKMIPGEGVVSNILKAGSALTDTLQNAHDRYVEAGQVLSSTDQVGIQAVNDRLFAIDQALADYVDKS